MSAKLRKIMFLGSKARPVGRADNLAAFREQIVWQCRLPRISQAYRHLRPVTVKSLLTDFILVTSGTTTNEKEL
jgi:hypothetical protein